MARIEEYGYADADFLAGYGVRSWVDRLPRRVELLYRLYTATLLAVVFHGVKAGGEDERWAVARVVELCAGFNDSGG